MENTDPIGSIQDSLTVIVLVEAINELKERVTNQEGLHEILVAQYTQSVNNCNKRLAELEQQMIKTQESLTSIAFANKEN